MEDSNDSPLEFLKEVKPSEMRKWRPQRQRMALEILEAFLNSSMEMAEVRTEDFPDPVHRDGVRKSTKQDSFASSFYAWKRKKQTQDILKKKGIDIILIRKGEKTALKKKER